MIPGVVAQQTIATSYKRMDTDARNFLATCSITDSASFAAINTLVVGFKSASLWTKCISIYPFIGGTSTTNKYNLKNTADQIAFTVGAGGSISHSIAGITFTGSGAYGNTGVSGSQFAANSVHYAIWAHNNGNLLGSGVPEMGCAATNGTSATTRIIMAVRLSSNISIFDSYNATVGAGRNSVQNISLVGGFWTGCRSAANSSKIYINGSLTGSIATTGGTQPTTNTVFINGTGTANLADKDRTYTFASIGNAITDADALSMYNIVRSYQIILQRTGSFL